MDGGLFPIELKTPKRTVTIRDKLVAVRYFNELKKKKEEVLDKLKAPRPTGGTRASLREFFAERKKLKKSSKTNLEKECRKRYPDICKNCTIARWAAKAAVEQWETLPEELQARLVETPNAWRRKVNAPVKGQKIGGSVPMPIQKELDWLMIEVTSGLSSITERREIVTVENIVSCCCILGIIFCF